MAASTIEPAIGASTWAFGSHRCRPYRGIFTINAVRHAIQIIVFDQVLFSCGCRSCNNNIDEVLFLVLKHRIAINRGKELASV